MQGENEVPSNGCQPINVKDQVARQCDFRERCIIEASNDLFGDPCPETFKYLNLVYSCEYDGWLNIVI